MTMIKVLCITLLSLITYTLTAQTISSSELKKIEGNWKGKLTYTDYKDDLSQSTLKCKMEAKWKNKRGILTFIFVEPNGRIVKDKTKIKLKKNGSQFVFDAKYQVLDFKINEANGGWELTIKTKANDNNRNAEIKCIISCSKTQFTIIKRVKYEGTNDFFERNRYVFEKDK